MTLTSPPAHWGSFVGVDVGANVLWFAAVAGHEVPELTAIERVESGQIHDVAHDLLGAAIVAIDAPAALSERAHLGDARFAPKFQRGRCSEVALRRSGIAVPFITPSADEPLPSWMATGFSLWQSAQLHAGRVLETYPHAVFWRLAGRPLLNKQTAQGRAARREVLGQRIQMPLGANLWPHDALDALACALVAWLAGHDAAERVGCEDDTEWRSHDGSAMWLPPATI